MAYDSQYYLPADIAAQHLQAKERKKAVKKERKEFRARAGCSGCYFRDKELFKSTLGSTIWTCSKGNTPHSGGFCKEFWDIRTGRGPDGH